MIKINSLLYFFTLLEKNMSFYYAVAKGRKPGIYKTWDECKEQIHQFSGPVYKKFRLTSEAENFIAVHTKGLQIKNVNSEKTSFKRKRQMPECFPIMTKHISSKMNTSNGLNKLITKRLFSTEEANNSKGPLLKKRKAETGPIMNDKVSGNYEFNIDNDGFVNVWTDGACSHNGSETALAGIGVYFGSNHPLNISQSVNARQTNNFAEIKAATTAIEQAAKNGITKLKINTDSQFLINCMTLWISKWKRNDWKNSTGKTVINKIELQELDEAISLIDCIKWNHVRGHAGNYENDMADSLARAGVQQSRKQKIAS